MSEQWRILNLVAILILCKRHLCNINRVAEILVLVFGMSFGGDFCHILRKYLLYYSFSLEQSTSGSTSEVSTTEITTGKLLLEPFINSVRVF